MIKDTYMVMSRTPVPSTEYLADHFDGEGCITLSTKGALELNMSHTYLPVLEQYQRRFGGSICRQNNRPEGNKPIWRWKLVSQQAARALETLRPFLQEKAVQAWLGLEFMAQRTAGMGHPPSDEERALRNGYYLALQIAKRA